VKRQTTTKARELPTLAVALNASLGLWNLPFVVMLAIVVIYFALQLVGLAGDHGDHGGGADGHGGHDHDLDGHDGDHGVMHEAFAFLGGGKVPFLVVWTTFFIVAGFVGLATNRIVFLAVGGFAPAWLFPAAPAAAVGSGAAVTRLVGSGLGRALDGNGTRSTSKAALIGRFGVVASVTLDGAFGEVRVHDGEQEILVHGRTQGGEGSLGRGARVVLVDFDEPRGLYWVTASPDDDKAA